MIIIKVEGSEKLRFEPHLVGDGFVVTPRRGRRFPIPIGSDVYDGAVYLGKVIFMLPEQFQRCRVVLAPPLAAEPDWAAGDEPPDEMTSEEWEAMREEPDIVVPEGACGDVPEEGSIEELDLNDRLLNVLAEHGLSRLLALRSALSQGDELLLEIDGIGPASLRQIKTALEALEQAKGALDSVEMPDARLDG